jgi:hypothetical protein
MPLLPPVIKAVLVSSFTFGVVIEHQFCRASAVKHWLLGRREVTLALACVAAPVLFQLLSPYFLTGPNLVTILRNSVELLLGRELKRALSCATCKLRRQQRDLRVLLFDPLLHEADPSVQVCGGGFA